MNNDLSRLHILLASARTYAWLATVLRSGVYLKQARQALTLLYMERKRQEKDVTGSYREAA